MVSSTARGDNMEKGANSDQATLSAAGLTLLARRISSRLKGRLLVPRKFLPEKLATLKYKRETC